MKKALIDTWVFDLDNTLYPPAVRLFDQIELRMETFMMRELAMTRDEAKSTRAAFWRDYGTTLAGLMSVYEIEPDPFLDEVHDIDHSALETAHDLSSALQKLEGRCVIYTNGSRRHAQMVTKALGIDERFDAMFGIEDADYHPKPHSRAFEKVFEKADLIPQRSAMFEDDPRNLKVPHEIGMATVLVGGQDDGAHIHYRTDDLAAFLNGL